MKHLRQIVQPIEEAVNADSFKPQPKSEKEFASLHTVNKIADRNGNGDEHFNQTKVKTYTRKKLGVPPTKEDGNVHVDTPLQKGVKVVATEEVEPVEELSKPLIQRYLKGARKQIKNPDVPEATKDKRHDGHLTGTLKKYGSNVVKVKATESIVAEITDKEWEDSAEDKRVDKKNGFKDGTPKDEKADKKMVKAINKAEKTVKESLANYITSKKYGKVEKVEEISTDLAKRYVRKAVKSHDSESEDHEHFSKSGQTHDAGVAKANVAKREKGIGLAHKKIRGSMDVKVLTKEEVESVEELSKSTLLSYADKARQSARDNGREAGKKVDGNGGGDKHFAKAHSRYSNIRIANAKAHKETYSTVEDGKVKKNTPKVNATESVSIDPHQREPGTDSLVNNYKSVTPGEAGKTELVPPLAKAEKKKVSVEEAVMLIKDITVQEIQIEEAKKVEEQPVIVTEEAKPAPKKSMNDLTNSLMKGGF